MESHEMDRLMSDIQDYLNTGKEQPADASLEEENAPSGSFIAEGSREKIPSIMQICRVASYAVEILVIALFTAIIIHPPDSWPKTLVSLCVVLLCGIFMLATILSYQGRIQLLLKIEANTRSIAVSKARIADALQRIHIE